MTRNRQESDLDYSFNINPFFSSLSYRDFLTSLSLALLLLAFYEIIEYYLAEDWVYYNQGWLRFVLFIFFLPINHVVYKIEHQQVNNFIGRNLHDHIFILLFFGLRKFHMFLQGRNFSLTPDDALETFFILVFVVILIMSFEAVIALLKRFFKLFKWQIL
jgi:hypothetical protein